MFLVRSVYFNLRNILPKSGTFLPGHPVYIYIYIYMYNLLQVSAILECPDQGVLISVKVGGTQEVPKHVGGLCLLCSHCSACNVGVINRILHHARYVLY
jgi:hypothetical protein